MAGFRRGLELRLLARPLVFTFALALAVLLGLLLLITSRQPGGVRLDIQPGVQSTATAELRLTETARFEGAASGQLEIERTAEADRLTIRLLERPDATLEGLVVRLDLPPLPSYDSVAASSRLLTRPLTEARLEATASGLELRLAGLSPDSVVSLELTLPPGTLVEPPTERLRRMLVRASLGLAVVWPGLGLLLAIRLLRQGSAHRPSRVRSSLPASLPPAIVGILVSEVASSRLLLATLLDLAEQGAVTLKTQSGSVEVRPERSPLLLRDFEQVLVDRLDRLHHPERSAPLRLFERDIALVYLLMYDATARLGVFVESPRLVVRRLKLLGGLGFLVGLLLLLGSLVRPELLSLRFLGLGGLLASLLIIGLAPHASARTRKGERLVREWLEFRNFLRSDAARGLSLQTVYHYLPYAIALRSEEELLASARDLRFRLPEFVILERKGTVSTFREFRQTVIEPLALLVRRLGQSRDPALE